MANLCKIANQTLASLNDDSDDDNFCSPALDDSEDFATLTHFERLAHEVPEDDSDDEETNQDLLDQA